MEYTQKRTSPLLAQILSQMQQSQQYQPQSWGALAAGLGTAYLQKKTLDKALADEEAQRQQGNTLLADMLTGRPAPKNEDPAKGPLVELASRDDTIARILEGGGPELLHTGLLLQQAMTPRRAEAQSPAGKLRSDLKEGHITPEDYQRETTRTSDLPSEVKLAQFLFPDNEDEQRKFLQNKASAELPAQVQMALWASNGDAEAARKLVLDNMKKGRSQSLADILAPALQKMVSGETLTDGERAAMDWYKQNPLAALMAIFGAQAGSTVED